MQNVINGTGNGGTTKPEEKPVKLNTVTSANYGDYVNYPVTIGRGPEGIAETHKSDWRIFYNDGTYVYLIATYFLPNNQMPSEITMTGWKSYITYWENAPEYIEIGNVVRNQYKMSWNKNITNDNIKCVSELLDTSKWTKFVNNIYAEDAVGAPTLEMWVESWNAKESPTLYCNNSNEGGYYIGTSSQPTDTEVYISNNNNLYFPVNDTTASDDNGFFYWLASPWAGSNLTLYRIGPSGSVYHGYYKDGGVAIRPIIRLKSSVLAVKDENGIWQLK